VASLLHPNRPPAFCPGCSHDRILKTLDKAFQNLGLQGDRIAIVSDIGCSGLFDTFFQTHALHGLHGRALTYAAGLKLARPDLNVVVTMGDGGMGIGGAHLLAACRRNLDLTLLVLNNFNFGMTGGQCSATTPPEAAVGSGFLNELEQPMDVCRVAAAAGAPFVARCSAYAKDLADLMQRAIAFEGFSVLDIQGICPGRYLRRNKLPPAMIEENLARLAPLSGPVAENQRAEYGRRYRETAARKRPAEPPEAIEPRFPPLAGGRREVILLGAAGQRVLTAGEILGIAGLTAGLHVTQKNDYNITVMTGPSISELIFGTEEIDYTGSRKPSVILALAAEGVGRRRELFASLGPTGLVLQIDGVEIPQTPAQVLAMDLKALGVKPVDWALASLGVLAALGRVISGEMLDAALALRFSGDDLDRTRTLVRLAAEKFAAGC
jgi:2-oxoglutarate/2-oxoacid ferredoxin oxidoreductase subunit beta